MPKKDFDFYETPDELSKMMTELYFQCFPEIKDILEPCCGHGQLLKFIPKDTGIQINDIQQQCVDKCKDFVNSEQLVDWTCCDVTDKSFTFFGKNVITNPPYSDKRRPLHSIITRKVCNQADTFCLLVPISKQNLNKQIKQIHFVNQEKYFPGLQMNPLCILIGCKDNKEDSKTFIDGKEVDVSKTTGQKIFKGIKSEYEITKPCVQNKDCTGGKNKVIMGKFNPNLVCCKCNSHEDVYKIGYTDKEFKTKYKYALCVREMINKSVESQMFIIETKSYIPGPQYACMFSDNLDDLKSVKQYIVDNLLKTLKRFQWNFLQ